MIACPKCERGGTGPHPKFCTPEMRFWRKVRIAPSGCWEWQGSRHPFGYGQMRLTVDKRSRLVFTHRWIYEQAWGEIPDSLVVMHRCDNPCCVRPVHLALGTQGDNMRDAYAKGRLLPPEPAPPKTHCAHGHEFTRENTYINADGWRSCRICHRIQEYARKQRIRENAA